MALDKGVQEVGRMKKASAIAQLWVFAVFSILSILVVWFVSLPPPLQNERVWKIIWSVAAVSIAIVCIWMARSASADRTEKTNVIFALMT